MAGQKKLAQEFLRDINRAATESQKLDIIESWLTIHGNVCIEISDRDDIILRVNIPIHDDTSEQNLDDYFARQGYTITRMPPFI